MSGGKDCLAAVFIQTMPPSQDMNAIPDIIYSEIDEQEIISFARFMELALYAPGSGYYETPGQIGRAGDFYTNISAGPLFGELLGFQFAEWLEEGQGKHIVEAGAHDGQLASDIIGYLKQHRPQLAGKIKYWIIEPSEKRREWQREKLVGFGRQVKWKTGLNKIKEGAVKGVIFGNELVDAFPVHRLGWDKQQQEWFEWGVVISGDKFGWERMESPDIKALRNGTFQVPRELRKHLPDGFVTVCSPVAAEWWHDAADRLGNGRFLAIDYGLEAEEFFFPERVDGTLRSFSRHHPTDDLLANPGHQDITASVNFTVLKIMGELAGLSSTPRVTQEKFLMRIFEQTLKRSELFPEWTAERRRQFQTLTHPDHLGRPFQVMVQSRV